MGWKTIRPSMPIATRWTGSLLDLALEMEIVQKRGSWFSHNGSQLAQGRDAAKELLKGNEELYHEIENQVKEGLEAKRKH